MTAYRDGHRAREDGAVRILATNSPEIQRVAEIIVGPRAFGDDTEDLLVRRGREEDRNARLSDLTLRCMSSRDVSGSITAKIVKADPVSRERVREAVVARCERDP